ncbi:hypothetical protein MMC31_003385, partial [Peltigera leucophlebia]|nr:hypothetical protein [Peltigera leucophlebia]
MAQRNAQAQGPIDPNQIAGLTTEQNQQIFEIYRQKAEEEHAAAAREHALKIECMKRESEARIAATTAAVAASPTPAYGPTAPWTFGSDEDIL